MKARHAILAVLVLAVLTGPLVGCRSSRKAAAQQPVAMQPGTVMRGPTTTYVAPRPAPPTNAPSSTAVMPPPATWGSPDQPMASGAPGGFPAFTPGPGPSAPAPVAPQATAVILEERASRQALDQQIVAIEEKLNRTKLDLARRNAPPAPAPNTAVARTGGDEQAAHFAAAMKTKALGEVERNGSLVIIRFSDAFQPGSELLKKNASLKTGILAAANELATAPGAEIRVVGHSDGTPLKKTKKRWGNNVNLSRERAQTVATELSKHGVPAGRIGVDGRGSVEPLVFPENSDKDRARNRRVEIHVRF